MTFDEFDDADFRMIQQKLAEQVRDRNVTTGQIPLTQSGDAGFVDVSAIGLADPFLDPSGKAAHRRIQLIQCCSDAAERWSL